jgi:arylsulfatase A-like enzyme
MVPILITGRKPSASAANVAVILALAISGSTSAVAADKPARPFNVLFIAVDDLNDWINPLGGYPRVQTPNLDRLAAQGMLFTRAYCSAPACNPSRASLLTGVPPSTSGVYDNGQPWRPVMRDVVTLPQHFKSLDYHVVGGGKVFHGAYPDRASWHEYFDQPGDPVPSSRPANGIGGADSQFDWSPLDVDDAEMGDTKVTTWAVDYLRQKHSKPYFLAVGLYRPHLPWYVPRKYFDRYPLADIILPQVKADDLDDVPPIGRRMARPEGDHRRVLETNNWEKGVQGYLASITFADSCVGRLLDALDASGEADRTIIVLWGDHGWHLGEKLHWRKFTLWEEATRVPLVIVAPGVTGRNVRCERTVSLLDLYATLAELCGSSPPSTVEGHNLVLLLKDPSAPWRYPVVTTHGRNNHAVRSERWRYIRYRDGTEELYDHEHDPMEWTNLAGKPEHESVKKELAAWLPKVNAPDVPKETSQSKAARGLKGDGD